jgi:hypothetical protein
MGDFKQEMREPEPCQHPDERMQMTIRHPSLRIPTELEVDLETGKTSKKTPMLSKPGVG